MIRRPPRSTRTDTLFPTRRSSELDAGDLDPPWRRRIIDDVQQADVDLVALRQRRIERSEEHTSEIQSIMRNSYAVFCLKKKIIITIMYRIMSTFNILRAQKPNYSFNCKK